MKTLAVFLLFLLSLVSYVLLATNFGFYQKVPFINLAVALGCLAWMGKRLKDDFKKRRLVMNILSVTIFCFFCWWIFSFSNYKGTPTLHQGEVITETFANLNAKDSEGQPISLLPTSPYKANLLVFYRGFW